MQKECDESLAPILCSWSGCRDSVRSDPREESGAAHRRLARPLGNGDRRTVWDLGPDEKAGRFACRIGVPCRAYRSPTRQTDAACETSSFFVWTQIPNCSPITIPKRPSKATMGGAGLFTRIRPYKIPTPKPTTKDMNKTFIAFLLHKSCRKAPRIWST